MRLASILLVLIMMPSLSFQVLAQDEGEDECGAIEAYPGACRLFQIFDDSGEFSGQLLAVVAELPSAAGVTVEEASAAYVEGLVQPGTSLNLRRSTLVARFGDGQVTYSGFLDGQAKVSLVAFWVGDTVNVWMAGFTDRDPWDFLFDLYSEMNTTRAEGWSLGFQYLPEPGQLPDGTRLIAESILDGAESTAPSEDEPSVKDLEATIAALQTQVAEPTQAPPTPSPTPTPRATQVPKPRSTGPVEILDISNRDAGIGNGTQYVYVDVKNVSGGSLYYVGVDITCRDANDRVVTTGIANTLNVPAGATVTLTGILMGATGCTTIHVQVSPLTG